MLLLGANGQVGWALLSRLAALGGVIAKDRRGADLEDLDGLRNLVRDLRPDVIVNAAAYTAVDRAESERDLAHRINVEAVGTLADAAADTDALLVHYSTDYVFDGSADGRYRESGSPAPMNEY